MFTLLSFIKAFPLVVFLYLVFTRIPWETQITRAIGDLVGVGDLVDVVDIVGVGDLVSVVDLVGVGDLVGVVALA